MTTNKSNTQKGGTYTRYFPFCFRKENAMYRRAKYVYNGPIVVSGRCVANNWRGETWAESESKARSNLSYQAKTYCRLFAGAKVELPGKLLMI